MDMETSARGVTFEDVESVVDVGKVVRSAARLLVAAQGATFVLRDVDKCFYADEDAIAPLWKGQRFPLTQCISGWAMLNGEPAIVPDIELDARIPIEAYRPTFVKSLLMVPVHPDKAYAAIGAYWDHPHEATPDEVAALTALAADAAAAIDRVGLHDAPWAPGFDDL
jgi:GAF domain-containing protein